MYLKHFGFREYPFSLTPDTEYFFANDSHREALNVLRIALRCGDGFIAVTAEVGLGKTLLCRMLLRELEGYYDTAYIPDPQLCPRSLRIALAEELGILFDERWSDEQLMRQIQRELMKRAADNRRVVLLLDESHELPSETLESVRLLTNLETEKAKLLQVVLFGQPELEKRLQEPQLRQLRQRIGFCCTLVPLDRQACAVYVAHRVRVAGCAVTPLFDISALDAVYRASGGTPRLINLLCHKALMAAYGAGDCFVNANHMQRAIHDSRHTVHSAAGSWIRLRRWLKHPFKPDHRRYAA